jgi:phosphatidylglycerophosphate synthase
MLDRSILRLIEPALRHFARPLARMGVSANALTWGGFAVGLVGATLITQKAYGAALLAIAVSRLGDALDGAVARQTQPTDLGGFLDITLDFVFYASIALAFALADPARNALASAVVLAAFVGTASSFLAFAVLAAKRGLHNLDYPNKSFYFLGGLTEGTETLAFFAAACLWPDYFAPLAFGFAALCAVTLVSRLVWGMRAFAADLAPDASKTRYD